MIEVTNKIKKKLIRKECVEMLVRGHLPLDWKKYCEDKGYLDFNEWSTVHNNRKLKLFARDITDTSYIGIIGYVYDAKEWSNKDWTADCISREENITPEHRCAGVKFRGSISGDYLKAMLASDPPKPLEWVASLDPSILYTMPTNITNNTYSLLVGYLSDMGEWWDDVFVDLREGVL